MYHGSLYLLLPPAESVLQRSVERVGGGVAADTQVLERTVCTMDYEKK